MSDIVIIVCIRSGIDDIIFALQTRNTLAKYYPRLIFYFKDKSARKQSTLDYLKRNVTDYELYASAADVKHKCTYDNKLIININPTHPDHTHSYNLYNTNNAGIFVSNEIPTKTFSWWDNKYYNYDNVFTCHLESSCTEFLDFIGENFKQSLVIIQSKNNFEFSDLPVVKESTYGKVVKYSPNVHVLEGIFTLPQTLELFYYSHPITAISTNSDISICVSYKKTMMLGRGMASFYDFVRRANYSDLLPVFGYLTARTTETAPAHIDYMHACKTRLDQFYDYVIKNHNQGNNLLTFIESKISGGRSMETSDLKRKFIIAMVVLLILFAVWQLLKAVGLVQITTIRSECRTDGGETTCS